MKLQKYYKWPILLLFIIIPIVLYTSKESFTRSSNLYDYKTDDFLKQKPVDGYPNNANIRSGYTINKDEDCFTDCIRYGTTCVGFTTKVENNKRVCQLKKKLDFGRLTKQDAENYNTYKFSKKLN